VRTASWAEPRAQVRASNAEARSLMGLTIGHRKAREVASRSDLEAELDDHLQDFSWGADLHAGLVPVLRMENREVAATKVQ